MVVAIFCGHPDNLKKSDVARPVTVACLVEYKTES